MMFLQKLFSSRPSDLIGQLWLMSLIRSHWVIHFMRSSKVFHQWSLNRGWIFSKKRAVDESELSLQDCYLCDHLWRHVTGNSWCLWIVEQCHLVPFLCTPFRCMNMNMEAKWGKHKIIKLKITGLPWCSLHSRHLKVIEWFLYDLEMKTREQQKQQTNRNRAIWLVCRTDTNMHGFWLDKRTFGWKIFMPKNRSIPYKALFFFAPILHRPPLSRKRRRYKKSFFHDQEKGFV